MIPKRDTTTQHKAINELRILKIKDKTALSDSSIRWGDLRFGCNILIMLVLLLLMLPVVGSAETEVEGEVSGEWTAEDSPYIVVDSTWVPEDEELLFGAGVEVFFAEGQGFYIFGTLDASGTEDDSVRIRVADEVEHWRGLRFYGRNRTEWNYASIICPDIIFVLDLGCSLTMNHCLVDADRMTAKENDSSVENCNLTFSQSSIRLRYRFGTTGGILSASYTRFDFSEDENERPGFYSTGTGYILTSCEVIGELHPSFGYSIADSCRFLRLPNGEPTGVGIIGPQGRIRNCYVEGSVGIGESYGQLIRCENNVILGGLGFFMCNIEILDCEVMGEMRAGQCESVVMRNSILSCEFRINDTESMIIDSCYFVNGEQGRVGFMDLGGDRPHRTITRSVFLTTINMSGFDLMPESLFDHNTVFFDSVGFSAIDINHEMVFTNNIIMSVVPGHKIFGQTELPIFEYNCVYGFEYAGGPEENLVPIDEIDTSNIIANPLIDWDGIIPNISFNSPCIDAGDPDSPLEPDSSRSDIGAFYFDCNDVKDRREINLVRDMVLLKSYPNPFNTQLHIDYILSGMDHISLNLYNTNGRRIALIDRGLRNSGLHSLKFDAGGLSTGTYFIQFVKSGKITYHKVNLIN